MARNKYPEETEKLILDTAQELFLEKGYERTSLNDIISRLGGLSKGAIYHHFRSKEEILVAVAERMSSYVEGMMKDIINEKGLNGREKLSKMFWMSIEQNGQREMFKFAPRFVDNPRLLSIMLYDSVENVTRDYILPIVEEGIRDGSIETDYPEELSEVMMLLGNVWLNPMVFEDSREKMTRKFRFYKEMLERLGLPIISDDLEAVFEKCCNPYYEQKDE